MHGVLGVVEGLLAGGRQGDLRGPAVVAVGGALEVSAFDEAVDNGGDRGLGDGQAISELRRPLAPLVDERQHSELGQRETSGAALEHASETNQRADIRVPHDPHQHSSAIELFRGRRPSGREARRRGQRVVVGGIVAVVRHQPGHTVDRPIEQKCHERGESADHAHINV